MWITDLQVAGTIAQDHEVVGTRTCLEPSGPHQQSSHGPEQNYNKVECESLTVYSQIKTNRRYLYGARFVVIVDHELLVTLYKGKGKNLPVRVAKHMSKLRGFNFTVTYEPGKTTPCDYDSLHPPQSRSYSKPEKEEYGVENEEDDCEIIFNRVEHAR